MTKQVLNAGPCIDGPLDGAFACGCPNDEFTVDGARYVWRRRRRRDRGMLREWRGTWLWEHSQQRDDLPADRN